MSLTENELWGIVGRSVYTDKVFLEDNLAKSSYNVCNVFTLWYSSSIEICRCLLLKNTGSSLNDQQ